MSKLTFKHKQRSRQICRPKLSSFSSNTAMLALRFGHSMNIGLDSSQSFGGCGHQLENARWRWCIIALVWLYVYGFVHPQSGRTQWLILPRVNVDWFNAALAEFAKATGASTTHRIVLILDNAGWHRCEKVVVPEGIHLLFLPPYSPELQPAPAFMGTC
jgi:hypothetical protein